MDTYKHVRNEYRYGVLRKKDLKGDPIDQLNQWLDEALNSEVAEPTAMSLSTVDASGQPSSRIVLLKKIDKGGLVFFTHYESRKGKELAENPKASLLFFWPEQQRQIRVEGECKKAGREVSGSYFSERPLESRISAVISPQSSIVPDREFLEKKFQDFQKRMHENEIQRPEFWGGYVLIPSKIEFWQGRTGRLHDRFLYQRDEKENKWKINRLAP
mgnify:CR=1 FL=1